MAVQGNPEDLDRDLAKWAEDIFCAAYEIEAAEERRAFVAKACGSNEPLRSMVVEMLESQPGCDAFFDECGTEQITSEELTATLATCGDILTDSVPKHPSDPEVGGHVGPYRIVRKLGEGGIGNVYLAQQERPVKRLVALKTLKAGMDTRRVIERFEAERQMLAMMEHPNIAHVYDAGETESGRPFFVMEFVDGVPVTTYCDEHGLGLRERLALFIEIAHGVQHAHHKGVIHRDIKPSNVLVSTRNGTPVPKVIDFGIAKATREQVASDQATITICEPFIGTPVYMSPEQSDLTERDVDMRSDIYSLGILLYELLVGTTPFSRQELVESGLQGIRRILCECEPLRPSAKYGQLPEETRLRVAKCRGMEPRQLVPQLAGELDWIVMKAIEKDREQRFKTVDALAEDVLRYLNCEPVVARPPSRWYRFRKQVRRNKGLYGSIAAISMVVVAGLGMSLWLYARERAALRGQIELRRIAEQAKEEAELARSNETRLRTEAEAREKITQAAVLLNRNRFAEAEKLMEECELPVIKPSLEASDVFLQLAYGNIFAGRWEKGADHLLKYAKAVQVDKTDLTEETTRNLLGLAPALIAAGKQEEYLNFLDETIEHFSGTRDPIAAEQIIKITMFAAIDDALFTKLEPYVEILKGAVTGTPMENSWREHFIAWRCMSVAIFEYRVGRYSAADEWASRSLERLDSTLPRIAMSHIIRAMALNRLGERESALAELRLGREMVERRLPGGLDRLGTNGDSTSGYWHDWANTYLLLQEALGDFAEPR